MRHARSLRTTIIGFCLGLDFESASADTRRVGTYLRWTGQARWIVTATAAFFIGGTLVLVVSQKDIDMGFGVTAALLLLGMAMAWGAFGWLCAGVRCPRCRVRVFWHSVSRVTPPRGITTLLRATRCLLCGYPEGIDA